jgi:hypothetical protein
MSHVQYLRDRETGRRFRSQQRVIHGIIIIKKMEPDWTKLRKIRSEIGSTENIRDKHEKDATRFQHKRPAARYYTWMVGFLTRKIEALRCQEKEILAHWSGFLDTDNLHFKRASLNI